jgi:transposase-like protein
MGTIAIDSRVKALVGKAVWTAAEAAEIVAAWRASGASLAAFARAHGTHPQRIRNWRDGKLGKCRGRTRAQGPKRHPLPALLPIRVVPGPGAERASASPSPMEVVLKAGRSIKVGADFDPTALTRLLTTLEGLPC